MKLKAAWAIALTLLVAASVGGQDAALKESFSVPFELRMNLVMAQGTVNGKPGQFIIDTGCRYVIVTPAFARSIGLKTSGGVAKCESVGVGDALVKNLNVAVNDPPQVQPLRRFGVNYSGILGTPYLSKFLVTYDYVKRRLTFVPVDTAPKLEKKDGSVLVPFETPLDIIVIKAKVNGKGPFPFVFDSGAAETVVTPTVANQAGIRGRQIRTQLGPAQRASINTVSVEGVEVHNLPGVVIDPPQARPLRSAGVNYGGILGKSFFEKFLVTIDYRNKQIRLESNKGI